MKDFVSFIKNYSTRDFIYFFQKYQLNYIRISKISQKITMKNMGDILNCNYWIRKWAESNLNYKIFAV